MDYRICKEENLFKVEVREREGEEWIALWFDTSLNGAKGRIELYKELEEK